MREEPAHAAGTGLVVQNGSAAHTIAANVVLGSNQSWEIDNAIANGLTISGVVSDGGAALHPIKTGTGLLTLTGANTYTGNTVIQAGTLQIMSGTTLGTAQPLGKGTTVLLSNSASPTNSTTLELTATGTPTLAQAITVASGDSATLFNNNGGTSGVSTFTGAITITGATLGITSTISGGSSFTNLTFITGGITGNSGIFNSTLNVFGVINLVPITTVATYYGPTNIYGGGTLRYKEYPTNWLPASTILPSVPVPPPVFSPSTSTRPSPAWSVPARAPVTWSTSATPQAQPP